MMRKLLLSCMVCCALQGYGQVGIGTPVANSSAVLDVTSTTKGVLMPRLTQAQRLAMDPLPAAAPGLLVYQTDGTAGYYYNSSATTTPNWVFLAPVSLPLSVADGGTGATTAAAARTTLGAAASGANTDITSLAPASAGAINNMAIGGTTPAAGTFTTLGATGVFTANAGAANSFTLPAARGSNGEVLTTNGSGAASWTAPAAQVPAGTIVAFAGTTAPAGWAFCNGAAVSRTTNAPLFLAISTTYGSGDGSSTFNLPDLRGRTVFGKDDMGGTTAQNRITNAWGLNGIILGATGGSQSRMLTVTELPSHYHSFSTTTSADGSHSHDYLDAYWSENGGSGSGYRGNNGTDDYDNGIFSTWRTTNGAGNHSHSVGGNTNNAGSGNAFSLLNPGIVLNYIIKL